MCGSVVEAVEITIVRQLAIFFNLPLPHIRYCDINDTSQCTVFVIPMVETSVYWRRLFRHLLVIVQEN